MVSKVTKIEDLEFYINEKINYDTLEKKNVSLRVENSLNIYDNAANIVTSIEFFKKDTDDLLLKEKLKMTFEGDFKEYNNYAKSTKAEEKQKLINLSVRLSIEINGTIRGILFMKTKDYPMLSKLYIPLMDENSLRMKIDNDINS